jgi:hypothetical protein
MSVNDPFRSSTMKSAAIAGSSRRAAAGSFMDILGSTHSALLLFKHRKLVKNNVGKVVADRLVAEKSQRPADPGVLSQGQLEQLFLIDIDQP